MYNNFIINNKYEAFYMIFNDIFNDLSKHPSYYTKESAGKIVDFIKEDTEPAAFDAECRKYKDYTLDSGTDEYQTALGKAALVGNIALVNHIMQKGDISLLSLTNKTCRTPLHSAIECENKEKGHKVAKRLLQLGTPVNIVKEIFFRKCYSMTPLELSLAKEYIPTVATLLRAGGIARPDYISRDKKFLGILEKAKELIQTQDKKAALFKLQHKAIMPDDITNTILSLYAKLI